MQAISKTQFSERLKAAITESSEVSEHWVGTLVSAVIDYKRAALKNAPHSLELLLSLEKTIREANKLGV